MSSTDNQFLPTAAARAAPYAVVSIFAGLRMPLFRISACICIRVSFTLAPPSTDRNFPLPSLSEDSFLFLLMIFSSQSKSIASSTSADWYAIASSAARQMCAFLTYLVNPTITPLLSSRQCGANKPPNAGTNVTPPLFFTVFAHFSTSSASFTNSISSLSHRIHSPPTATAPSSAYSASSFSPNFQHTVVKIPRLDRVIVFPVFRMAKHPVPYVFFESPSRRRCPRELAC
mmetsp:Transcript_8046/g.23714  ORF Transcript_8046/g.23714 Transcript_8046/m.23714 type:complete len:230 (-) Transcript_8046:782-1471(-)